MLLLIDPQGAEAFILRTSSTEHGDLRRYYCARSPWRAILVTRNGLDLLELRGLVVDAQVGYEDAWREFARSNNKGLRHTKVTVYRIAPGARAQAGLGNLLRSGEKDKEERIP